MKKEDLYDLIDSLSCDIEFIYNGVSGAICPFSRENIALSYGGINKTYDKIEELMTDCIYDNKCLADISNEIQIM